ncbi:hypothetical protein OHA25_14910 [Nonomuraea sp. NBC_00507]|uniref:hypothetical protein n=1 Tax=Nonomuraea sp. NBC_00507 TaxID=2976002 RepID=UPI002E1834F0
MRGLEYYARHCRTGLDQRDGLLHVAWWKRSSAEHIRSKLKRLISKGILVETEPGLFAQPRP